MIIVASNVVATMVSIGFEFLIEAATGVGFSIDAVDVVNGQNNPVVGITSGVGQSLQARAQDVINHLEEEHVILKIKKLVEYTNQSEDNGLNFEGVQE
ncbi:Hypothetical predicted protein [Olea europaea subsp. europaea]|uniref:Uncharacterized protein n=1 Tax=Olea europaea subsp. europaea TaxID=158383 RepID=A0A8S0T4D6_OLEEU|nr:Hypothetical predicted protein [Olea europaea subsp. europaea]